MNEWLIRWRKLKFKLTPPRLRSPFCKDDPWLVKYEIGEWTYGRIKVLAWGNKVTLKIGHFCSLGSGTTIFLDNGEHSSACVSTYPLRLAMPDLKYCASATVGEGGVVIGNDVWVGDAATILSGVRVGNGAIIGARSVVTKNVPAYAIAVGNPARFVRLRFTPEQITALEQIAWWNWPLEKIQEAAPLLLANSIDAFITKYGRV